MNFEMTEAYTASIDTEWVYGEWLAGTRYGFSNIADFEDFQWEYNAFEDHLRQLLPRSYQPTRYPFGCEAEDTVALANNQFYTVYLTRCDTCFAVSIALRAEADFVDGGYSLAQANHFKTAQAVFKRIHPHYPLWVPQGLWQQSPFESADRVIDLELAA